MTETFMGELLIVYRPAIVHRAPVQAPKRARTRNRFFRRRRIRSARAFV